MKKIKIAIARLCFEEPYSGPPVPHLLRGAIAISIRTMDTFTVIL